MWSDGGWRLAIGFWLLGAGLWQLGARYWLYNGGSITRNAILRLFDTSTILGQDS